MGNMFRHLGVNLARQFNKTGMLTVLTRFPRKIERIDRDAVTAQTGTWIKRQESDGFCCRDLDTW
jgi:hypothetical protein